MRPLFLSLPLLLVTSSAPSQTTLSTYAPVDFSQVKITDSFWSPKIQRIATTTLQACIEQTEVKTPRIRNFLKVASKKGEKHEGIYYDDSDVYKALEAIAYSVKLHPDSGLLATADRWIDAIAAAQMPDGYLNTYYELGDISRRWTELEKHEDYCAGHLIEAAVAYYRATGKRKILDVAIRFANHIDSTMRLQNKRWFSGHQEIELALMKLYRLTGNDRYAKLAHWYLEQRGKGYFTYGRSWFTPDYWQDLAPVKEQKRITGHAVRAMYMYSGAADVAAATGDMAYVDAMKTVWDDVVHRNMYLTGGIGSTGDNEGFGKPYDLPNDKAYCETCASVGMVFWNERMNQLTGESRYIDVLERSLYNGALDGLSLSGDRFFYDNPLASSGGQLRQAWFGTACCPSNITRLVGSIGSYVYGRTDDGVWVNLFVGSSTTIRVNDADVVVTMETGFPWDGKVKLTIGPSKPAHFALHIRIPNWATGETDTEELYRLNAKDGFRSILFSVNAKPANTAKEKGYAVITRDWLPEDVVEFELPMPVLAVTADAHVANDADRVALQRGPMVYCIEGADNGGKALDVILPPDTPFRTRTYRVLNEPVVALEGICQSPAITSDGKGLRVEPKRVIAIPYYVWANRGSNEMQVWIPTKIKDVKINN